MSKILDEEKITVYVDENGPSAVFGPNTTTFVNGKKVQGRKYPWGFVDIQNKVSRI